jgi:ketosteroid isomerase-like protein
MMDDRMVEKKKVEQVWHSLMEADLSKDIDRIMDHFSDDIVYQVPGFPPIIGKDALRNFIEVDILEDLKWGIDRTEVAESGDLAYSVGWYKWKVRGFDGYMDWKGMFVYRKESGIWKIVADSYSINTEEGRAF